MKTGKKLAIIVDKIQKRKDIALSCVELFTQSGINDLTISQVAQAAGVGKGTIYEYFRNKEEIVFEILTILMERHNEIKEKKLCEKHTTKEKIKIFYDFFYNPEYIELRQVYKEFLSISLSGSSDKMLDFQTKCYENYHLWMDKIILEGIEKGEIKPIAKELTKGLFAFGKGMFISSISTTYIDDLEGELNSYLDNFFELIEIKN